MIYGDVTGKNTYCQDKQCAQMPKTIIQNFLHQGDGSKLCWIYVSEEYISQHKWGQEGIFVGPQISEVMDFENKLRWAENYCEVLNDLSAPYKAMGFNMPLKTHYLDSYLDFILENLSAVSGILNNGTEGLWLVKCGGCGIWVFLGND